ncbi:uncharacterized protein LOC108864970 [Galendromus occidentalis]|uniref:Uncharacterized protein LOC108864970 n=1 Tax=Galendromus occidentalis TaxID=34638 RepID=A0AAJ7L806_9ACAR|nr:uncharacterized protein LOC108864970 [Galendromus occidentalis]
MQCLNNRNFSASVPTTTDIPDFVQESNQAFIEESEGSLPPLDMFDDVLSAPFSFEDLEIPPYQLFDDRIHEVETAAPAGQGLESAFVPHGSLFPDNVDGEPHEIKVELASEVVPMDTVVEREVPQAPEPHWPRRVGRRPPPRRALKSRSERQADLYDIHGLNKYDRLLAKMPKSKAGRKKKSVTANMTKHALAARENRERRNEYIEELREGLRDLFADYKNLQEEYRDNLTEAESLRKAVAYYVKYMNTSSKVEDIGPFKRET